MENWDSLKEDFSRLGGIAENIDIRQNESGIGIYPIDPKKPIKIYVPEHLLIEAENYLQSGDNLIIDKNLNLDKDVRSFLEIYQNKYSWGCEGRSSSEQFEESLTQLPLKIVKKLEDAKLLNISDRHRAGIVHAVYKRFLYTRQIHYQGRKVLMPIIELINHSANSTDYIIDKGIRVEGIFSDEVTVNYSSLSDSLGRFFNYGFASHELRAYSVPIVYKLNDGRFLHISRNTRISNVKNGIHFPQKLSNDRHIKISYLLIADERYPRLPRGIFRKMFDELSYEVVDEIFERVRSYNIKYLCDLLADLESHNQEITKKLRAATLMQLRNLSNCYGIRDLRNY
jgi:hypothetical protein